eukprot:TRINITY_DN7462_c0_g1_i1.p2 TRINITY_DN7462_c0_g1~~TRINITY_DN7462_c0_g1_i1.p2  ORF type:complete len:110 (-),score=0.51 TRINITY_DN7462_c0_g1_i1:2458-2787(-)
MSAKFFKSEIVDNAANMFSFPNHVPEQDRHKPPANVVRILVQAKTSRTVFHMLEVCFGGFAAQNGVAIGKTAKLLDYVIIPVCRTRSSASIFVRRQVIMRISTDPSLTI